MRKEKWRRKCVKAADIMVKMTERASPGADRSKSHQIPTDRAARVAPNSA